MRMMQDLKLRIEISTIEGVKRNNRIEGVKVLKDRNGTIRLKE